MKKLVLFLCIISLNVFGNEPELEKVFSSAPLEGTIVIENLNSSKQYVYNKIRANTKLAVASTFKIPNTLIAVDEKFVSDKSSIFEWDGTHYDIKKWNDDQTLASAFQVSCVWCYQQIAKAIGVEKYKTYIKSMNYGSLPQHFDLQNFWLDGTLKLSAYEQVSFLKRLYHHDLPFSDQAFSVLQDIMLVEQTQSYSIFAKSGWAKRVENPVGWYVGYVESKTDIWFFATNLAVKKAEHLYLRKQLTLNVLKVVGAI